MKLQENPLTILLTILTCLLLTTSCSKEEKNPYRDLSMEYYSSIAEEPLKIDAAAIRAKISRMYRSDSDSLNADQRTRRYYRNAAHHKDMLLWISRQGVSPQADTLLACLDSCHADGFKDSQFRLDQIRTDMARIKAMEFTDATPADESISIVLARLEYNLTKAFLRYAVGQRFGFVNPADRMNHLDIRDSDSIHTTYRQLFDIPIYNAGKQTYNDAIRAIRNDSVGWYLQIAQPKTSIYQALKRKLAHTTNASERERLIINMERARWRTTDYPDLHKEYVIVNIPAYHLWAMRDGKNATDMRIGCGSRDTKTPLLYSKIKRMDINPQWVIPGSIKKKDIARHAGNAAYFESNHYFAMNRHTGKRLDTYAIPYDIILSADWAIVQEGGEGNSLGRIIFRFDNNFSVFLHDTSSRGVFAREDRSVSHGCVRVEQPYDLACYMLRGEDQEMAERIKYSMETDISAEDCDRSRLVSSVKVDPQIPLYIVYYTAFPVPGHGVQTFPDVYGYDDIIAQLLKAL